MQSWDERESSSVVSGWHLCFFADYVVLLASTSGDLQPKVGQFVHEWGKRYVVSAVMWMLYWSAVVKSKLSTFLVELCSYHHL